MGNPVKIKQTTLALMLAAASANSFADAPQPVKQYRTF